MHPTIDQWRARWYPHGLKTVPPHITIIPPFIAEEDSPLWEQIIQPLMMPETTTVRLHNFGRFIRKTSVVFVRVEQSPALEHIYTEMESRLATAWPTWSRARRPFHPHVTIANRLNPNQLAEVERELLHTSFEETFRVREVFVYQKGSDRIYRRFASISLDI